MFSKPKNVDYECMSILVSGRDDSNLAGFACVDSTEYVLTLQLCVEIITISSVQSDKAARLI